MATSGCQMFRFIKTILDMPTVFIILDILHKKCAYCHVISSNKWHVLLELKSIYFQYGESQV
jgi:hypothetical protein